MSSEDIDFAASAFLIYDIIVTLDSEVNNFWAGRLTGAKALFFANRYIALLSIVAMIATNGLLSDKGCTSLERMVTVTQSLMFVPWAAFSAARAYVLGNNKPLSIFLFLCFLMPLGVNLAPLVLGITGEADPIFGCTLKLNITTDLSVKFVLMARLPLILADAILVFITWWSPHTRDVRRSLRHSDSWSFSTILLQNGTIYFIVMFILNVAHLVFSMEAIFGSGNESFITTFTSPLTSVLVSRFLLQLQQAHKRTVRVPSDHALHLGDESDPHTGMDGIIGSLGSVITIGIAEETFDANM
ncbi:hypothetical protein C8Q74DRAFT_1445830 [Fomes fomentarius]|nr:hypothetical protein C8Q74DRAFT_1445830 [Fomes fomentarius]